ncbi:MAG: hypothetical protein H7Y59_07820 [Anaerolineales bacterium]|nr:hypothetical protein [Anaerolineales bacterium]
MPLLCIAGVIGIIILSLFFYLRFVPSVVALLTGSAVQLPNKQKAYLLNVHLQK